MQVIEQWTGAQADALRQALRMTLERFAERVEMSPAKLPTGASSRKLYPAPTSSEH
jgi:DNA-binding transcriptional regulator YiaG